MKQQTMQKWIFTMYLVIGPLFITTVLAMLRQILPGSAGVWDVVSMILTFAAWAGAVLVTFLHRPGKPLAGTGLFLGGILLVSVLCFALSFALEQDVFPYQSSLWVLGQFLGGPCTVSVEGLITLCGSRLTNGTAAMLTGGLYLCISFAAGLGCILGLPKKNRKKR